MDISILLGQFWGWLMLILTLTFLFRRKALMDMYMLASDNNFTILSGFIALIIGLISVLLHNIWVNDWRVIVTIFGWLSLIKGIVRIGYPESTQKILPAFKNNQALTQLLLLIAVLVSSWLLWSTY
jgi:hypothetical protein